MAFSSSIPSSTGTIKFSGAVKAKLPLSNGDIEITISKSKMKDGDIVIRTGKFSFNDTKDAAKFIKWINTKNIKNSDNTPFDFNESFAEAAIDEKNLPPHKFWLFFEGTINDQIYAELQSYLILPSGYVSDKSTPSDSSNPNTPEFRSITVLDHGKVSTPPQTGSPHNKTHSPHAIRLTSTRRTQSDLDLAKALIIINDTGSNKSSPKDEKEKFNAMPNKVIFAELRSVGGKINALLQEIVTKAMENPSEYQAFLRKLPNVSMKKMLEQAVNEAQANPNASIRNINNLNSVAPGTMTPGYYSMFPTTDALLPNADHTSQSDPNQTANIAPQQQ